MRIPIMIGDKQLYLIADSRQYILAHSVMGKNKDTKELEEKMNGVWYYSSLTELFEGLFNLKLRSSEAKTLNELYESMVQIKKELLGYIEQNQQDFRDDIKERTSEIDE